MADTATDKSTVNLVVLLLGIGAIIGLSGLIWLVHDGVPAATLVAISTPVATIVGALGAVLSSTRSVDIGGLQELNDAAANQAPDPAPLPVTIEGPVATTDEPEQADASGEQLI
jgi:hypothetical protein